MKLIHNSRTSAYRNPFGAVPAGGAVHLTLDVEDCVDPEGTLRIWIDGEGEKNIPMQASKTDFGAVLSCVLQVEKPQIIWYSFKVTDGEESATYGARPGTTGGLGVQGPGDASPASFQLTVYVPREVAPEWLRGGIVYQIFPDRFCRGDDYAENVSAALSHPRRGPRRAFVDDWYKAPRYERNADGSIACWDFYGGTLRGIMSKLDYLRGLGVTAIYLNPIFEAASNHRYDTADYHKIDPMLGTIDDFEELCVEADKRGIGIILDGVFNHTGRDSRYFNAYGNYPDLGASQSVESEYRDWYNFAEDGTYGSWWGILDLPDMNEKNPTYQEFVYGMRGVVRTWMRRGARGWRLDVADELPDFFIEGIADAVRTTREDGVVIGEVWEDASNKVSYSEHRRYLQGSELDGVMGYYLREPLLGFLTGANTSRELGERVSTIQENYPPDAVDFTFNLLGTHDTMRLLTVLGRAPAPELLSDEQRATYQLDGYARGAAIARLWLAVLLQMTLPGLPCIYYGDEAGCEGYADPYNRACFPWGRENMDAMAIHRNAINLRNMFEALRTGTFTLIDCNDDDVFAFARTSPETHETVVIVVNRSNERPVNVQVPCFGPAVDEVIGGQDLQVEDGFVHMTLWQLGSAALYFHADERLDVPMLGKSGIICHISSLPSADGGPGTLGADAMRFVDWLKNCRQSYWQILPVNPTDNFGSPYAGMSAFAGNPALMEGGAKRISEVTKPRRDPAGFDEFCQKNAFWLDEYAAFQAIKSKQGEHVPWQQWPEQYRTYSPELLRDRELAPAIRDQKRIQFEFQRQWDELRAYTNRRGIKIIGDMPMYVSADSADVWAHPEMFRLDEAGNPSVVAGAPPDQFSADGQVWGNPTYNWDLMRQTDYEWWYQRIKRAMDLYDYVRLDHFLGFANYYAIPAGKGGADGAWQAGPGFDLFRTMSARLGGNLPLIAEDLGVITPAVRALMARCGFPGMDVVQFADVDVRHEYQPPANKIAYTGTHDNATLLGFCASRWGLSREEAHDLARDIIVRTLDCRANTVIMPLQDVMGLGDEARMNVPGRAEGNWTWQASWDEIVASSKFLTQVTIQSRRG